MLTAAAAHYSGALAPLRQAALDELVVARAAGHGQPRGIVVIDIDESAVQRRPGGLPLNRRVYARLIDLLSHAGAHVIAIDVMFANASPDPASDDRLLRALERTSTPVVLATTDVFDNGDTPVMGGRRHLRRTTTRVGSAALQADKGVVSEVHREVAQIPTFAQAVAQAAGGEGLRDSSALLDPSVPADAIGKIPLDKVLRLSQPELQATVRGRIVVIGVTALGATGGNEFRAIGTPGPLPAVFLQAQAINTSLKGGMLRDAGDFGALFAALATTFLTGMVVAHSIGRQLLAALGTLIGLYLAAVVLCRFGNVYVDPAPASVSLIGATLSAFALRSAAERARAAAGRATLSRFVPSSIVDELLDHSQDGQIPPQSRDATVMFCDLRGYTSLVSQLERPDLLIVLLDRYLAQVTETVMHYGGTVVSFQGDGVMTAFGVPAVSPNPAGAALCAAARLRADVVRALDAELCEHGVEAEIRLGIGIATGAVFAGTVGPARRREYAVVGTTTNLAARLQARTKEEAVDVLIDGSTIVAARAHASGALPLPAVERVGQRAIRGLENPVELWTLTDLPVIDSHQA
jgi:adenylate cyclase